MANRYKIRTEKDISDAALTILGNTSGTNTGDQVGDGVTITGNGTAGNPFVAVAGGGVSASYVESASANAYDRAVSYTNSATANLEHNNLQSMQGGDASNRYHLAKLEYDQVRSVATAAVTGMLSPSDYTTFNNKQNALAFTAETENKFLRDDNTFQPIETAVGGYANNLYFSDTESDIATYNTLTYTAPSGQATHTHTVNSSEGNKLLHAYIYPSAVSVDIFPSGIWSFKFYGNISSTSGVTQIGVEYFARHQDTSETTLFTDWSDEINNTTDNWFVFPTYTHPAYSINATDRMGARVYVRTTHNSDVTISYYIGDGYGAYLNNPNKIRHSQLRGLNDDNSYLHVSSAEKATWNGKAEVSYVESASANAYNAGVAYTNSATANSYLEGISYTNAASSWAYTRGTTYSNSASANAYSLANTYSDQKWVDINRYGFVNPYNTVSIGFNDATNVFTLTDKGSGWSYYRAGVRHAISGNKTVTVPVTAGDNVNYFIYIDSTDGSLTAGTSSWTLNDTKVPVAVIHYDSAYTPKYLMSYECHSCGIDRAYHREHHFSEGSEYVSGGVPADYVLNSTNDADKVFGISAATMADEDLFLVQSALTKPNGSTAVYPILYRVSTTRYSWYLSDMPFRYGGTPPSSYTYIEYDAAGSSTPTVNNRWVNTYLFLNNVQANDEATQGTSTSAYRFFIVQGRGQFSSLALAQGESFSSFGLAGFPVAEGVALYQLTWSTGGVANSVKGRCQLAAVTRINSNIVTTSAVVSTNHNTLTGLQGGQSGEYYHLTADQHSLAISTASAAATGLLMSDDWNTFNNKAGTASPVFTGTVSASAVKITGGAANGYVYTSDAVGVGRWVPGIDLNSSPADLAYSGITSTFTAGENVTAGQVCYLKNDGKVWLAKADSVTTAGSAMCCLATGAVNANNAGTFLLKGYYQNTTLYNMTPCVPQYVSAATGGAMTEVAPSTATHIVRIVGYAHTADIIYFCPDTMWLEI